MPPPLRWIVLAVVVLMAAWIYLVPAFQAPDENAHFGYVQHLAETGHRPGSNPFSTYRSTEQTAAAQASNADQVAGATYAQPMFDDRAYDAWRARSFTAEQRANGRGHNPAAGNPPGYYALAVVPYAIGSGLDLFGRVLLVRAMGILFAALLAIVGWHLAACVMPGSRSAQTAAAAVCSLLPMVDFIEGTVSPDGLLMLLWALAFLAGAKVLSGRLRWGWALAAATLAAIAVKFPSAALAPGIVVVVAAAYQRHARWPGTLRGRRLVVAGIVAAAVVVAVGVIVSGVLAGQLKAAFALPADHTVRGAIGEFLSYLWQYYLPRLPWQTKYEMHYAGLPLWTTSFRGYVGAFGWLEVVLAPGVYIAAAVLAGAALVGGLHSILARARRHVATILFFLVTAITLMIGLHWTDYQIIENDQGHFMQARYLLPLNPLVALVIAAAVGPRLARRPRAQSLALGGVLGGLLALQLLSLGTVLLRFYG